jgi:hypothetical protein
MARFNVKTLREGLYWRIKGKESILDLKGLGKEIWAGIDAVEYVRNERDSWDDDEPSALPGTPQ